MKKILIVTYYWPPFSGSGVQRWLNFSNYLTKIGWDVGGGRRGMASTLRAQGKREEFLQPKGKGKSGSRDLGPRSHLASGPRTHMLTRALTRTITHSHSQTHSLNHALNHSLVYSNQPIGH